MSAWLWIAAILLGVGVLANIVLYAHSWYDRRQTGSETGADIASQ